MRFYRIIFTTLLLISEPLIAQEALQGIVAYKKSPSHPDENAKIQTFRSYEYSDPRYLFFTGTRAIEVTRFQGPSIYLFQNPDKQREIRRAELFGMRAQLSAAISFTERFKKAASTLEPEISALKKSIKRLEIGQSKIDGLWLSDEDTKTYLANRAPLKAKTAKIAKLKAEIRREQQRLSDAKRSATIAQTNLRFLRLELQALEKQQNKKKAISTEE